MCKNCNNNCGCDKYSPCNPDPCGCKYTVYSNCVLYNGEDFLVIGATQGDTLSDILQWIDNYLSELTQYVFLAENTGTGIGIYSGINVEAVEEFKSLLGTESVNVALSDSGLEIIFSINEEWLTNFIVDVIVNGEDFLTVDNVGTGAGFYKDTTVAGNVKTFNLKTLKTETVAGSVDVVKEIRQDENEVVIVYKRPVSDTLNITETENEVRYEVPTSTSNLAFYVDVNSISDLETGSIANPFKTLNKALDAFIGTGTWYNPQFNGYKIILLSACGLLETNGVDYNGYTGLDVNNLFIEGNGFYLSLPANPSTDYYPISTRRMVTNMPKTANVMDYEINMRFQNIVFQRLGTNAIVDNLNYAFPTATLLGAFPPVQPQVFIQFKSCNFTNDTARLPNVNWNTIPNPNDGGNPLLLYGNTVYASNTEPVGVYMIKSEGRNWNKEGGIQFIDCNYFNLSGGLFKFVNTTYQDYGEKSVYQFANYFRLYDTEVNDHYSPRLGFFFIELEDVNYCQFKDYTYNNTIPTMFSTELTPRNIQIGGCEAVIKLTNSSLFINKGTAEEQVLNFCLLDGNSNIEMRDFLDNYVNCEEVHKFFKVVAPLPITGKSIFVADSDINEIVVDETSVDTSYIKEIVGYRNTINNAPHSSYSSFTDDVAAKAAGLIKGNVYYNTTLGGLKTIL